MNQDTYDEDIMIAFQFGMAFGFAKKYNEMDKVLGEVWRWKNEKDKITSLLLRG